MYLNKRSDLILAFYNVICVFLISNLAKERKQKNKNLFAFYLKQEIKKLRDGHIS
jgi:hypothetical protein